MSSFAPIEAVLTSPKPRIAELTDLFITQRKRTGGDRARKTAERATLQHGESFQDIAIDLEMPCETVKTYAKLACRTL